MSDSAILIIGGGIGGLTTAWHLAEAGCGRDVILLEAEPHLATHSSALNAAILRTVGPDLIATRIALASARFLRDPPPGFSSVPLVDQPGLVLTAAPEREAEVRGWIEALEPEEVAVKEEGPGALRARVPAFEASVGTSWFFPEEGRLDIAALVAGYARGARRGGVELRRNTGVERLLVEAGRVVGVRLLDGGEIRAGLTVLAAGGWAGQLGRAAGARVALQPTRRHLLVTEPHAEVDRNWPVLWYFEPSGCDEFYCRPEGGGMLFCACEVLPTDPNRFTVDSDVRTEIARKAMAHLPRLSGSGAAHFWCGLRTLTSDGQFAIGPDPDREGLFWVAGLGGSGMVASAEVGRIASRLILGEDVPREIVAAIDPARLI